MCEGLGANSLRLLHSRFDSRYYKTPPSTFYEMPPFLYANMIMSRISELGVVLFFNKKGTGFYGKTTVRRANW